MGYLSISLNYLQYPLAMFYSFQCIGLLPPWLSLFLGIFCDAVLNGIVFYFLFLLSVLDISLLNKRKDFCILILYPATLLSSLISSNGFCVETLGFSIRVSCHMQTVSFPSSLPIWIPFISFSCLTAVTKTYNTMLNRSDQSGHPCITPEFSGKAFSFSPLSIMLAVGL